MGAVEQFIKQKNFSCEYEKAHVGLLCASSILSNYTQNILKDFDITLQQYNVLRILRGQHPMPVNLCVIKERLIDRNSDTSRLIERLRKMDLISRVVCEKDRRAVNICINKKGLDLLAKIDKNAEPDFFQIVKALSEKEVEQLNKILDKLVNKGEAIDNN